MVPPNALEVVRVGSVTTDVVVDRLDHDHGGVGLAPERLLELLEQLVGPAPILCGVDDVALSSG